MGVKPERSRQRGILKQSCRFREKKRTEYTFSRHDHYVENISSFHFTFFFSSSSTAAAAPRHRQQREPSGPETQNQLQTDSTGKVHINSSLCLFLFISLHIRKKIYIKCQYEETEYKLYSIKTILSGRNVQKS